jgi:hypothetical protein
MKTSIFVVGLTLVAAQAFADTYTYDINGNSGFQNSGVTGFITTSCDSCVLNAGDVTAWSLAGFSSTVPGSTVLVTGNGLVATPTGIFFNFNPGPTNDALFSELPNPTPNSIDGSPNSVEYTNSAPVLVFSSFVYVCGLTGCNGSPGGGNVNLGPLGSVAAAPEIDPITSGSALTLLLGALAVLRGRRPASNGLPSQNSTKTIPRPV